MKFETIEEVAAPQDYTFARFTDFTRYEGLARKYGADIRRVGGFTEVAEGATWRGTMQVRGKTRGVEAVVTRYAPPEAARIDTVVGGMNVVFEMRFEALGPDRIRLRAVAELQARTLAARLIIQSIKLTRKRVQAKINSRIVALANEYEDAWRREQG
ncbi:SRPBCC family protein [Alterinioella nitratireducens]|uniref:SRPBCC family protein n=1 Tax=Alterinioella nitratireducens TaxID=2735915 RepID=UPI001552435F|nr:SRPBCC family protein [Alterinioella nitratireducens]NPD19878.1 SRPBCC family protein [Alterinioella nitratireducens]